MAVRMRDGRVLSEADLADLSESLMFVNAEINLLAGHLDGEVLL